MAVSQKLRILALLQAAGDEGISSLWFIQNYLPRVAARIRDLKDEGWEITSEREGSFCRYTLQGGDAHADQQRVPRRSHVAEPRVDGGSGLSDSLFDNEVALYLPNRSALANSAFTNPDAA